MHEMTITHTRNARAFALAAKIVGDLQLFCNVMCQENDEEGMPPSIAVEDLPGVMVDVYEDYADIRWEPETEATNLTDQHVVDHLRITKSAKES